MRFCSSCGGQLEEGSHFCEKCGTAQPGQPAGAPAVPVPAPQVAIPPQPGQPFAGVPPQYPPPVIMGAPPGAQPTAKNPMMWVIGAGVIFGLWYIGTHDNNTPGTTPGGGGGANQAVVAAQKFTGSYSEANGQVQVTQGQWTNGSTVTVAAITLVCEEMDANGQSLAQSTKNVTGPAPPGGVESLPTFAIGPAAQGVAKANCAITGAQTQ
jgi:hypothetical protein